MMIHKEEEKMTLFWWPVSLYYSIFLLSSAFCFPGGSQKVSFGKAINQCYELGAGFQMSEPSFESVISESERKNRVKYWLPYRRVINDKYVWIDGTQADASLDSLGHELGFSCGAIDLENGDYDFIPCQQEGSSFICQIPDCSTCKSINGGLKCLALLNNCFTYHCGSSNWYRARKTCENEGGHLAVIKDVLNINLLNTFLNLSYGDSCATPWIGLYREQWQTHKGVVPSSTFWAKGEPKMNENCSIISIENHNFSWKVASCDDEYGYFCEKEAARGSVKTTAADTVSINLESQGTTKVNTFLVFCIVFESLILGFIVLNRLRMCKNNKMPRENGYAKQDHTIPSRHDTILNKHKGEGKEQMTRSLIDNKEQAHIQTKLDNTGLNEEEKVTFETASFGDFAIYINMPITTIPDAIRIHHRMRHSIT